MTTAVAAKTKPAEKEKGAIVPQVLGKKETLENYSQLLDRSVDSVRKFQSASVDFYAELGRAGVELTSSGKYGDRTVATFAEDLTKRTGQEIKVDSVYYAMRLRRLFTPEQLARTRTLGLPWRGVQAMVSDKINEEQRDRILDDVASGKLDKSEVREAASALARTGGGGGGGGSGGGPSARGGTDYNAAVEYRRFLALPGLVDAIGKKMRGTGPAVKEIFRGGDVEKMKAAKNGMDALAESIDALVAVLDHEFKGAREAWEKVKSAVEEKKRAK